MRNQYKVLFEKYEKVTEASYKARDYTVEQYEDIIKKLLSITNFEDFKVAMDEYFPEDFETPPGTSTNWAQAVTNLGLGSSKTRDPNYTKIANDLYMAVMETDSWNRGDNDDPDENLKFAEECFDDLQRSFAKAIKAAQTRHTGAHKIDLSNF